MDDYFLFNRQIWERDHVTDYKPIGWQCGKCGIGQLRFNVADKMNRDRKSRSFSCHLRCTNSDCDISYYSVGAWGKYDNLGNEISINYEGKECKKRFYPSAFAPVVIMFKCTSVTPTEITDALEESFKLFWVSTTACANAIRTVLERIMDSQAIGSDILHNRLEAFKQRDPINGDRLLAIKLVGNSGSHGNDLERRYILDAFEILAEVLSSLYRDTSKDQRIDGMVANIKSAKELKPKKP